MDHVVRSDRFPGTDMYVVIDLWTILKILAASDASITLSLSDTPGSLISAQLDRPNSS